MHGLRSILGVNAELQIDVSGENSSIGRRVKDRALDQMCISQGSVIIIFAIEADWQDHGSKIISRTEDFAQVNILGQADQTLPRADIGVQAGINHDMGVVREGGSGASRKRVPKNLETI